MKNAYYSYDITKVINVVLFITQSFGNKIHLLLLNKLLYSADILHMARYGYLITRDRYILMKNGPVPVNTYFLYTKLIEENNWFKLQYNILEFFFIKGNFIYCYQKYNNDVLSNSEVSCLFDAIQSYKRSGKSFLKTTLVYNISTSNSLFNELPLLSMAKTAGINNSMYNYIVDCLETEIFKTSEYLPAPLKEGKKLSVLSTIVIGSVLSDYYSGSAYIVVGMSFKQYMVIKISNNDHIVLSQFFDDLRKSFITLSDSYDFLPATAFINCSQIHSISHDQMYYLMTEDTGLLIGHIGAGDMETIFITLQATATLPANIKEELIVHV